MLILHYDMKVTVIVLSLSVIVSTVRAQLSAPSNLWTGYHLNPGDTVRLERHDILDVNGVSNGEPIPEHNEFDERHTISVDSVDEDGNIYLVDDVRSNSVIRTYRMGGTAIDETDKTRGWHRTLVIAKVSKTGKFLGGNEYWTDQITDLGDSVSMPSFRRMVWATPARGRLTVEKVLPVLGAHGLRTVGSSWNDTVVSDVKSVRYDLSVAPTGGSAPKPIEVWLKDTAYYQYQVVGEEVRRDRKCLNVRSIKNWVQTGADNHQQTETTMWLDESTGLPVDQTQSARSWIPRFPKAGGKEDASVVLVK